MTPDMIADYLRQIATAIENSKNPSKNLVIQDIQKLSAAFKPYTPGVTNLGKINLGPVESIGSGAEYDPPVPSYESLMDELVDNISQRSEIRIDGGMVDQGIGPYEYWGAKGVHKDVVFNMELPENIMLELVFSEPKNYALEQEWMKEFLHDKNGNLHLMITTQHNVSTSDEGEDITVNIDWKLVKHDGYAIEFEATNFEQS